VADNKKISAIHPMYILFMAQPKPQSFTANTPLPLLAGAHAMNWHLTNKIHYGIYMCQKCSQIRYFTQKDSIFLGRVTAPSQTHSHCRGENPAPDPISLVPQFRAFGDWRGLNALGVSVPQCSPPCKKFCRCT